MNGLFSIAVAIVSILSISTFLAIIFRKKIFETAFLAIGLIVLVLFLSGQMNFRGSLFFGYLIITGGSIAAFSYSIKKIIEKPKILRDISLISGFIILASIVVLSVVLNYERIPFVGDEYTHWATVVKHMYLFNAFGTIDGSTLLFKEYLPGTSLLEYFFVRGGGFVAWPLFVAGNLLIFTAILTLSASLKSFHRYAFIVFSLLVPTFFINSFLYNQYTSLTVDGILGLLFAFCVIYYFTRMSESIEVYDVLTLTAGLFLLTITKDMGIIFAGIFLCLYTIDLLFFRRKLLLEFGKTKRRKWLMLPVVIPGVSFILWEINTKIINSTESVYSGSFKSNLTASQKQTFLNFIHKFFHSDISVFNVPFFYILLIFLFGILGIAFTQKSELKKRLTIAGLGVLVGSLVYTFVLLLWYVFLIPPENALPVQSFERYMGSLSMALIMILSIAIFLDKTKIYRWNIAMSLQVNKKIERVISRTKDRWVLIVLGLILALSAIKIADIHGYYTDFRQTLSVAINTQDPKLQKEYSFFVNMEAAGHWASCMNNPNDRVQVISSRDNGARAMQLRYVFYGLKAGIITQSDNKKTAGIDSRATLVYVDWYDEDFKVNYRGDFDELSNNQLYRVNRISGKKISLDSSCGEKQ